MGFAEALAFVDDGIVTRTARSRCDAVLRQGGAASAVLADGATAAQRVDALFAMCASLSAAFVGPACRESRVISNRLIESLISASLKNYSAASMRASYDGTSRRTPGKAVLLRTPPGAAVALMTLSGDRHAQLSPSPDKPRRRPTSAPAPSAAPRRRFRRSAGRYRRPATRAHRECARPRLPADALPSSPCRPAAPTAQGVGI